MITYKGQNIYNPTQESLQFLGFEDDEIIEIIKLDKWGKVRSVRDGLISETDWTQTIDCPLSDGEKAQFTAYRQTLRDIPQNFDDPDTVVWPEKPTL